MRGITPILRAVVCPRRMSMRSKCTGRWVTALAGLGTLGAMGLTMAAAPASAPTDEGHAHWQMVETYCFKCHNATDWAASVAFDTMSVDAVPDDAKIWEAAIKKLKSGLMPPPGKPQPEPAARAGMVSWLESTLDKAQATPYTGYVPLR